MIPKIMDRLTKHAVTGWQIRHTRRASFQTFLARERREARRTANTESWLVTVHQRRSGPQGESLGLSSFKITGASTSELDRKIEEALFAASLVHNRPFDLPEAPGAQPFVEIDDRSLDVHALDGLEQRLRSAVAAEKDVRLSSAEFFINRTVTRLVNHRGLDVDQTDTDLETEFILLAQSGLTEKEFIARYARRFLADFDLEGEVRQSAAFAREALAAGLPSTGSFPVVFSGEPLDKIFDPIVARTSARLVYNKMMESRVGDLVTSEEPLGDRITLWSNSLLKGGMRTARFDEYGTPPQRVRLVDNGRVAARLADKRYADYLGVPVTGELGNIEVEPGSTSEAALLTPATWGTDKMYHIQAFSAFEPNAITGAFSAEIRAGYEISASGARPIKGGSVSGVLQDALVDCRLASEQVRRESALLPKALLFRSLTLAGE